jgi:hypothetical protein
LIRGVLVIEAVEPMGQGGNMKKKSPQLSEKEWPELRRLKAASKTGWSYFGTLVKTLHRELGEEKTCQILSIFMAENARKYVKPGMKGFGIAANDPWSLASYFKMATGDIIGYRAELIEESPKKVLYRLHPPCLWFPDLDIPSSFCRALGTFEEEATKIVNPRIKTYFTKLMTEGHPYCEIVFEEGEE